MFLRHHRVAQLVVFVVIFDDGARQAGALRDAEARGEAAGGDVADTTSMGMISTSLMSCWRISRRRMKWVGMLIRPGLQHQELADAVVQHALAVDGAFFLRVEGGGVVLEILHEGAGFRAFEQDFCFAFIELAAPGHCVLSTGVCRLVYTNPVR